MKQLSREEWIAVGVALVIGIALFVFSFLLMGFQQSTQEQQSGDPFPVSDEIEGEEGLPDGTNDV